MARACKRSRAKHCGGDPQTPAGQSLVDEELQIASGFLPGRIAASHIQTVARHVLKAIATIANVCGLLSQPAAELTQQLGEFWQLVVWGVGRAGDWTGRQHTATDTFSQFSCLMNWCGTLANPTQLSKETFDRRFIRASKFNIAEIMLTKQREWLNYWVSGFSISCFDVGKAPGPITLTLNCNPCRLIPSSKVQCPGDPDCSDPSEMGLLLPENYLTISMWMWDETDMGHGSGTRNH